MLPNKSYLSTSSGNLYDKGNPHNNFNSLSFNFLINVLSIITANLLLSVAVNVGEVALGSNIFVIGKLNLPLQILYPYSPVSSYTLFPEIRFFGFSNLY